MFKLNNKEALFWTNQFTKLKVWAYRIMDDFLLKVAFALRAKTHFQI